MRKNSEIHHSFRKAVEEKDNDNISILLMEVMLDMRALLIGIKLADKE
jgi:hypothetical protein